MTSKKFNRARPVCLFSAGVNIEVFSGKVLMGFLLGLDGSVRAGFDTTQAALAFFCPVDPGMFVKR
jgi:hypothetical protein